jgi:hypothetical protein
MSQNSLKNFFKKEEFKVHRDLQRKKNNLEISKMRRELGLTKTKAEVETPAAPNIGLLQQLAPFIRNMDGEQIADLIQGFSGGEAAEPAEGITGMLMNFANENPEMVKGILEGLSNKVAGSSGAGSTQNY